MQILDSIIDRIDRSKLDSDYFFGEARVPRVTKIIHRCIHAESLMNWANSLGFKHLSYTKELNKAANIGTECHESIESYLNDNSFTPMNISQEANNAYQSFHKWYSTVASNNTIFPVYHEKHLICKYFGGTLDAIYNIGGKLYLIDYKTSNHVTYNYCLQLAGYLLMLEMEGITVSGCIVLQLSKTSIDYNEYYINFDDPIQKNYIDECRIAFLSMVLWYYHLFIVDTQYKSLNW